MTPTTSSTPSTATGTRRVALSPSSRTLVPSPTSPKKFSPQQATVALLRSAHVWAWPAATTTASRSPSTLTGVARSVSVPSPSWPNRLLPQQATVPSPTTQLCPSPAPSGPPAAAPLVPGPAGWGVSVPPVQPATASASATTNPAGTSRPSLRARSAIVATPSSRVGLRPSCPGHAAACRGAVMPGPPAAARAPRAPTQTPTPAASRSQGRPPVGAGATARAG